MKSLNHVTTGNDSTFGEILKFLSLRDLVILSEINKGHRNKIASANVWNKWIAHDFFPGDGRFLDKNLTPQAKYVLLIEKANEQKKKETKKDQMDRAKFFVYVKRGNMEKAFEIIVNNNNFDVDVEDGFGRSALAYAVKNDDIRTINILLYNGADIDKCFPILFEEKQLSVTPLRFSELHGKDKLAAYLREKGAQTGVSETLIGTPLDDVTVFYEPTFDKIIHFLSSEHLAALSQLNKRYYNKITRRYKEWNQRITDEFFPGDREDLSHKFIAKAKYDLLINRANQQQDGESKQTRLDRIRFFDYIKKRNVEKAVELIDNIKDFDINVKDGLGKTALAYAVKNGDTEAVKKLCEKGARIDEPFNIMFEGSLLSVTPLQFTLWYNQLEMAEFLFNKGAKNLISNGAQIPVPFEITQPGVSFLIGRFSRIRKIETLIWLTEKNPELKSKITAEYINENLMLHQAIEREKGEFFTLFMNTKGVDVNRINANCHTPLDMVLSKSPVFFEKDENKRMMSLLIDKDPNYTPYKIIGYKDQNKRRFELKELLEYLVLYGLSSLDKPRDRKYEDQRLTVLRGYKDFLFQTFKSRHQVLAKFLTTQGFPIDIKEINDSAMLRDLIRERNRSLVNLLLDMGAEPNILYRRILHVWRIDPVSLEGKRLNVGVELSLIIDAAETGDLELIQLVLKRITPIGIFVDPSLVNDVYTAAKDLSAQQMYAKQGMEGRYVKHYPPEKIDERLINLLSQGTIGRAGVINAYHLLHIATKEGLQSIKDLCMVPIFSENKKIGENYLAGVDFTLRDERGATVWDYASDEKISEFLRDYAFIEDKNLVKNRFTRYIKDKNEIPAKKLNSPHNFMALIDALKKLINPTMDKRTLILFLYINYASLENKERDYAKALLDNLALFMLETEFLRKQIIKVDEKNYNFWVIENDTRVIESFTASLIPSMKKGGFYDVNLCNNKAIKNVFLAIEDQRHPHSNILKHTTEIGYLVQAVVEIIRHKGKVINNNQSEKIAFTNPKFQKVYSELKKSENLFLEGNSKKSAQECIEPQSSSYSLYELK